MIHALLTRPPLPHLLRDEDVRLACVRHAASVYPEPGSNSPSMLYKTAPHAEETVQSMLCAIQSKTMSVAWLVRRRIEQELVEPSGSFSCHAPCGTCQLL